MRTQRWLLYGMLVPSLCMISGSALRGQNRKPTLSDLPRIIRTIQPSTVVVLIYDEQGKMKGQGSGFFVSRAGHVVTNRHVLEGARCGIPSSKEEPGQTPPILAIHPQKA